MWQPHNHTAGTKNKKAIEEAASITAFHSDRKNDQTSKVSYGQNILNKKTTVSLLTMAEVDAFRT